MTPARSPLQELADVIRDATGRHNALIIADDPEAGDRHEYIARAVAAHLSRPETVERMVDAFVLARTTHDGMRAAVAAEVGEDV